MEPTTMPTDDMLATFAAEHPELIEALQLFSIASSEYERALRALYPAVTYAATSTHDQHQQ